MKCDYLTLLFHKHIVIDVLLYKEHIKNSSECRATSQRSVISTGPHHITFTGLGEVTLNLLFATNCDSNILGKFMSRSVIAFISNETCNTSLMVDLLISPENLIGQAAWFVQVKWMHTLLV